MSPVICHLSLQHAGPGSQGTGESSSWRLDISRVQDCLLGPCSGAGVSQLQDWEQPQVVPSRPTAIVSNSRAFCPTCILWEQPHSLVPRRAFQAGVWCGFPVPLGLTRPTPALLPGHGHFRKCGQDFLSLADITKFSMPVFPDQCGCAGKRACCSPVGEAVPIPGELCPCHFRRRHGGYIVLGSLNREHSTLTVPEQQHLDSPRHGLGVPEPPTALPRPFTSTASLRPRLRRQAPGRVQLGPCVTAPSLRPALTARISPAPGEFPAVRARPSPPRQHSRR